MPRARQWPSLESLMLEKTRRPGRAGGLATAARRRSESLIRTLTDQRIAIEAVVPEINSGRFHAKGSTTEPFVVEADIFGDGHDRIAAALLYRKKGAGDFLETPMLPLTNDRWRAELRLPIGRWVYTILAWRDVYESWRQDTGKKRAAGLDITLELAEGLALVENGAYIDGKIRRSEDPLSEPMATGYYGDPQEQQLTYHSMPMSAPAAPPPAAPPHQFGVIDEEGFHPVDMPQRGPKAAE